VIPKVKPFIIFFSDTMSKAMNASRLGVKMAVHKRPIMPKSRRDIVFESINDNQFERLNSMIKSCPDIRLMIDNEGFTPLGLAIRYKNIKIAKLLIEHGANVNLGEDEQDKMTPLGLASRSGLVKLMKILIKHGADVNKVTNDRSAVSPLYLASFNGHTQAVKLLVKNGADVNYKIGDNETALQVAVQEKQTGVIAILDRYS
jgi:ankyrin repeat protein